MRCRPGLRRSADTRMTRRPISAIRRARFATVAVLPSPRTALVIRIVLSDGFGDAEHRRPQPPEASAVIVRCPLATTSRPFAAQTVSSWGWNPAPGSRASPRARSATVTASLLRSLISAAANPRPRPSMIPMRDVELVPRRGRRRRRAGGVDHFPRVGGDAQQRHQLVLQEQLAAAQDLALGLEVQSRGGTRGSSRSRSETARSSFRRSPSCTVDGVRLSLRRPPVPAVARYWR